MEGDSWHWSAQGPMGVTVSWDSVVTKKVPNRRISWESARGSTIGNSGTVWFEYTRQGTTRVHVQMSYLPPAGPLGHALASLFGADPLRQMDADLVRLKSLIEYGKTSARGREVTREEVTV